MRRSTRVATIVAILLLHLGVASLYVESLSGYWWWPFRLAGSRGYRKYVAPAGMSTMDKAVVVAKMEEENTNWITNLLPEYVLVDLPTRRVPFEAITS